jgi:hypothetical protein
VLLYRQFIKCRNLLIGKFSHWSCNVEEPFDYRYFKVATPGPEGPDRADRTPPLPCVRGSGFQLGNVEQAFAKKLRPTSFIVSPLPHHIIAIIAIIANDHGTHLSLMLDREGPPCDRSLPVELQENV